MLKSILFTHDDLDGAGCRIVYELAHFVLKKGEDYDVINCGNNSIDDLVRIALDDDKESYIDTEICFADIVCSKELLSSLVNRFQKIKIWDHHATNFPAQQILPTATIIPFNQVGVPESGTSIIYKYYAGIAFSKTEESSYCHPAFTSSVGKDGKLLSDLVDTIRSYDTYEWKSTNNMNAKRLQTLFFMLGMEYFCNRYINRITEEFPSDSLFSEYDLEFVNVKLQAEQKVINSVTKDSVADCYVRGYHTAFLMYPVGANISEVAYQFLEKYPEYDLFASFTLARGGEFSFRTRDNGPDAGVIFAEPIGGGGHPNASGAPIQEYIKKTLLHELLKNMNGYFPEDEI